MLRRNVLITAPLFLVYLSLGASTAFAASYDLKEMTPAVQQAVENRQARYRELQQLKMEGVVGEDHQGTVKVLKDSPRAADLTVNENRDREVIYQAMAQQNGLGPSGITQVREVFAEVQRGKARPGEFIQLRSGEWVQK